MKILCLVGISGSGKSTYAEWLTLTDSTFKRVNRDSLRNMLEFKDMLDNKGEKLVTQVQVATIKSILDSGYNVIVDNTNLKQEYIDDLVQNFPQATIEFHLIDTSLEEAINRNNQRLRKVPESVIKKQHLNLEELKKVFNFDTIPPSLKTVSYDPLKQDVWISDIDGTLSDSSHRHIFTSNLDEIYEDKVIDSVLRVLKKLDKVIFVTGRDAEYFDITKKWLEDKCGFSNVELYTRPKGDKRKDYIIKKEIFDTLSQQYNILGVFDDRLQVTRMLYKEGYFTFNVNQGLYEF